MDIKDFSLQPSDKEKIKIAVRLHTPIEITTYTLPKNMEVYINEVLSEFLKQCHQEHMIEYLKFCVGELLTNSKKANTKRVYFIDKGLDINNECDYNQGMVSFKEDSLQNIDYYLEEQKKAGLYVKLVLQVSEDFINIEIKNNAKLTTVEHRRIQEKINIAQQYDNIEEVFTKVLDQTEGAGLGIIIIILMLQKVGLSKQNYKVIDTDSETITRIELPLNEKMQNYLNSVSDYFIQTQDAIPVIKENFDELKSKLGKNDVSVSELLEIFSKDITLSFLLLRDVVKEQKHCCSLEDAINYLSVNKLKEIFREDNPKIRFISKAEDVRGLWKHCSDVAFYAYNLAKNFKPKCNATPEIIYVFALLHDIECILLEVASEEQKNKLDDLCIQNNIPVSAIEMFYNESYHCKCGCMFSSSWGFPECISDVIKYHNDPDRAPENIREVVSYIYLADIIQYYQENMVEFYQINKNVLANFNIDFETKFTYIINQIKSII